MEKKLDGRKRTIPIVANAICLGGLTLCLVVFFKDKAFVNKFATYIDDIVLLVKSGDVYLLRFTNEKLRNYTLISILLSFAFVVLCLILSIRGKRITGFQLVEAVLLSLNTPANERLIESSAILILIFEATILISYIMLPYNVITRSIDKRKGKNSKTTEIGKEEGNK